MVFKTEESAQASLAHNMSVVSFLAISAYMRLYWKLDIQVVVIEYLWDVVDSGWRTSYPCGQGVSTTQETEGRGYSII